MNVKDAIATAIIIVTSTVLTVWLTGCTDPDRSRAALEHARYSDIRVGGYAWIGCREGDHYQTTFAAKGPTGLPARGVVCCGLLKPCTIRHD